MIVSFRCKYTKELFERYKTVGVPAQIQQVARRKLLMLDAALSLVSLKVPPNNRLETLKWNRTGQCNIRVNDQYRVCFVWKENNAHQVEIVDYH